MFAKNAISIFVEMQSLSVLSAVTNTPKLFESPNLLYKPFVNDGSIRFDFTVKSFPRSNDIRFGYQTESLNNEHDRTLARASLRRKPLPD